MCVCITEVPGATKYSPPSDASSAPSLAGLLGSTAVGAVRERVRQGIHYTLYYTIPCISL
jgi:hypothetical protein